MHHRSSAVRAAFLALALASPMAKAHSQVTVSAWPQVRMELVGTDATGNPLSGLTPAELLVKENKQPVKIDDIKPASGSVSVCLLLDTSGSMYERLTAMRAAVTRFVQALPPDDEFCIADFSWTSYLDQKLTTDRQTVPKALSYVKASGGTALYDSVMAISAYMRKEARNPSRVIVLFSDGGDNASKVAQTTFHMDMEQPGTPVLHIVRVPGPAHGSVPGHGDRDDERAARELTKMFGGFAYLPKNETDLDASVDHLNEALKNRYVLTYQSSEQARDGLERRVDVELDKAHQKAKAVVRAPEGYYAPLQ